MSTRNYTPEIDYDDDDEPTSSSGVIFPVYKQMGLLQVGNGEGPLVAMAKMIQDDAEAGGSYILRLGPMTVTMAVELEQQP